MKKIIYLIILILLSSFAYASVNDGLELVLNLNETVGTVTNDSSVNGRNFSAEAVDLGLPSKSATFGTSFNFAPAGGDDQLSRADEDWMDFGGATGNFSICFFMNATSWTSPNAVLSHYNANTGLVIFAQPSNVIEFTVINSGTNSLVSHTFAGGSPVGKWIQICAVRFESGTRLGVMEDNNASSTYATITPRDITNAGDFEIGHWGGISRGYDGKLDEIVVWNKVIGIEEVNEHFTSSFTTREELPDTTPKTNSSWNVTSKHTYVEYRY